MGLLSGKLPKKITPIIGGKKYPRENVISVTPSQERRIAGLLGHKGRVGKHGIKHYPPVSNSDKGVAETKASGGTSPGNTGNTNANSGNTGTGGSANQGRGGSGVGSSAGGDRAGGMGAGGQGPASGNGGLGGGGRGQTTGNPSGTGPGGQGNTNLGPSGTGGPMNVGRGGSSPGGGLGFGVDPASVARVSQSLNSLLGNRDKNLNYGYGTPGNPVPALNNRNPLQGNAPGSPNAYENQVSNLVNAVKPLSVTPQDSVMRHLTMGKPIAPTSPGSLDRYADMTMGGKFGLGSTQLGVTPPALQAVTDPYGGMGKFGINSGQTSPYNQPSPIAADPQMAGRLAETRLPGYGVPDLPQRGQVVAKTPGERVNLPSSGPQLGSINDMLGGLNSGWNEDQIASQISYPSEEGQIYGPASLANYNQPKIADRVPQYDDPAQERASIVNQWRQNQLANNSIPRGNMTPATPPVNAGMGPTFGPETPAGPEGWQQGDAQIDPTSHYSPQVQTTASKIQGALDAIGQGLLDNTPGGRLVKGGMWLGDQLSGGPAYRDDVSLGTDNSGRRTDRAPSGNGFSPGGFGPGGGDRRGNPMMGSGRKPAPNREDPTAPPVTPPGTPGGPTVNPIPWFYPQYQSTWAGLPVGLGGTYGRA